MALYSHIDNLKKLKKGDGISYSQTYICQNDDEIIEALLSHPKLIERPIVVFHDKAIIARPKEKINELIG